MRTHTVALSLAVMFLWQATAFAQGVLVIENERVRLPRPIPRPQPTSYRIDKYEVNARIREQIADVAISQTFVNTGQSQIEARFVFPLPYDGAIEAMTLLVDGKELPAQLLSREEARKQYEAIVRSQRDPALLEWVGTGMFQTSVFPIPAGESRTVNIQYGQLLRKSQSLTDFVFPLSTARFTSEPIKTLSLRVAIESDAEIKNIYSPTHSVEIKRPGKKRAVVTFEQSGVVPSSDFRLFFDAHDGDVNATLISYRPEEKEDGYFLLLASPEVKADDAKRPPKTVSFVVDKSGSMSGQKMEQAREAAKFLLNNLREGDLFNIISYDSKVESFRPELEVFNEETRAEALAYVDGLYAGGGTNIHEALTQALNELKDEKRPSYVLFLTDGRPTSGITNEAEIAQAAREANRVRARMMVFGVGFDLNSRLLDRLSRENHGLSQYVRPDEDIEAHVAAVYRRISSPVLTRAELKFEFDEDRPGAGVNRVYPADSFDLFEGEQLVVVGRYKQTGGARIRLSGRINETEQSYEFPGEFVARSKDESNSFIEKLWATRRIGEIIDELDLKGKNEELVEELLHLSTKHGILTPYTSFLADETVRPEVASASNRSLTRENLDRLGIAEGQLGFQQREAKQRLLLAENAAKAGSESFDLDQVPAQASPDGLSFRNVLRRGGAQRVPASGVSPAEPAARPSTPLSSVIRQTDKETVYKRGQLLVTPQTAALDLEKDQDQIQVIERFSADYFKLIAENSKAENQVLSFQNEDEQLLVQFRGVNYLIK